MSLQQQQYVQFLSISTFTIEFLYCWLRGTYFIFKGVYYKFLRLHGSIAIFYKYDIDVANWKRSATTFDTKKAPFLGSSMDWYRDWRHQIRYSTLSSFEICIVFVGYNGCIMSNIIASIVYASTTDSSCRSPIILDSLPLNFFAGYYG